MRMATKVRATNATRTAKMRPPRNARANTTTNPADRTRIARRSAAAAAVAAERGVRVEVHGGFNRPPKPIDAGAAKLFDLVRATGGDLGLDIGWRDTGGVCDGNNLAAQGLPVVDTLGVRGGAIHSADEFMLADSLVERARLSALVLMRLARALVVVGREVLRRRGRDLVLLVRTLGLIRILRVWRTLGCISMMLLRDND